MTKLYQIGTTLFATLAGLAAIGAGALLVAIAVVIGGLLAVAAKRAISGAARNAANTPKGDETEMAAAVTV
ncbi:MAG: hypothetical protein WBK15_13700 [Yoonia sp.]